MRETRESTHDVWGERAPFAGEGQWPVRVDERLSDEPERWVQSACVLCTNGCGLEIGVKGGRIVGESDELGYNPKTRPTMPGEVAATIFRGLGLDPHHELPGPQNRPMPLVDYGVEPIQELF